MGEGGRNGRRAAQGGEKELLQRKGRLCSLKTRRAGSKRSRLPPPEDVTFSYFLCHLRQEFSNDDTGPRTRNKNEMFVTLLITPPTRPQIKTRRRYRRMKPTIAKKKKTTDTYTLCTHHCAMIGRKHLRGGVWTYTSQRFGSPCTRGERTHYSPPFFLKC